MFSNITHTFISVFDQDEALDFYSNTLGLEVTADVDLGVMRWLTVGVPGQPNPQIVLMVPGPPAHSAETAAEMRELTSKGASTGVIFATDDCRAEFERLSALGVEFTQEPIEQPYGIDCGFRDPFGNPLRFTQTLMPGG